MTNYRENYSFPVIFFKHTIFPTIHCNNTIHFGAQAVLCSSLTLPDFQVFYRKWDTPFLHMFLKVMFKQWLWETDNCVRLGFVIIRSHSPANFDCNNSLYHIYIGVIKEHLSRTSIVHIKLLLNKDVKQRGLEHSIIRHLCCLLKI